MKIKDWQAHQKLDAVGISQSNFHSRSGYDNQLQVLFFSVLQKWEFIRTRTCTLKKSLIKNNQTLFKVQKCYCATMLN